MRIDAHQHFWQLGRLEYPWMPQGDSVLRQSYLPEDLEPILERNRFEGSVVVQAHHSLDETNWLLELAAAYERATHHRRPPPGVGPRADGR